MAETREPCVYCGQPEYEPGWGCHGCGTATVEDVRPAAHRMEDDRVSEDTAICQLCSDRTEAEIPVAGMGAHFRLFHPDSGVTEETIAQAEIVEDSSGDAAP